jgi:hypothetical protein
VRLPDLVRARKPDPRPLSHSRTLALSHFFPSSRAGAVLLEAMAALVILAVAGTAAVTMVSQSADAVRRAGEAEVESRAADDFFQAVSMWTRDDLDRRLGERPQGPWRLRIQRPAPTLYEVVLVDSAATREILRTSLYRPEPRRAEPVPPPAEGTLP